MQLFAAPQGISQPWRTLRRGTTTACPQLIGALSLAWSDGTLDPPMPRGTNAKDIAGNAGVDSTKFVWLVTVQKGVVGAVLIKESDFADIDTILGGSTWAVPWELTADGVHLRPQV